MFYRENGQFKTSYRSDQQIFAIAQDRWAILALIAFALVCIQMLTGIILARFHVPAVAQTVHLVVATLFFGAQYYLMLLVSKPKQDAISNTTV